MAAPSWKTSSSECGSPRESPAAAGLFLWAKRLDCRRDSPRVRPAVAEPGRHRRRAVPAGRTEEDRQQSQRSLPVSRRENPQLQRQPVQTVLSLLRLRRAWRRPALPDGVSGSGFRRGRAGSCASCRHGGSARLAQRGRAPASRAIEGAPQRPGGIAGAGGAVLCQGIAQASRGDRIPEGPRPERRGGGGVRHRLRGARLACAGTLLSQLRRCGAGRGRSGDRRRTHAKRNGGQALRPLSRAHHVSDPQCGR
jgi:hypothetical protein